jgi:sulfoxide reductase heme-binding subunit YedZ
MSILRCGFVWHDTASDFAAKHFGAIKIGLLAAAYATLFGFAVPQAGTFFGNLAQLLLLIILCISPLSKIFRMRLLMQLNGLRRELGIWFGFAAIVHGSAYMPKAGEIESGRAFFAYAASFGWWFTFGIVALFCTYPLLLTSNSLSVKLLKRNWKRLHRLVYVVFVATLLHIFLLKQGGDIMRDISRWLQFGLMFGGYVVLKLLARNNFIAPLREAIDAVAEHYEMYCREKT